MDGGWTYYQSSNACSSASKNTYQSVKLLQIIHHLCNVGAFTLWLMHHVAHACQSSCAYLFLNFNHVQKYKPVGSRFRFVICVLCNVFSISVIYCRCLTMWLYRSVYHCPFCNLCRLGEGLGTDFFHCMKCNCCLSVKLKEHKCREKMLEMNCPICCDFLFTSSAAVRGLPCGHFMHSACFQVW